MIYPRTTTIIEFDEKSFRIIVPPKVPMIEHVQLLMDSLVFTLQQIGMTEKQAVECFKDSYKTASLKGVVVDEK